MKEDVDRRVHADRRLHKNLEPIKPQRSRQHRTQALLLAEWDTYPLSSIARPANTLPAPSPRLGWTTPSESRLSQRETGFGYKRGGGGPACQMVSCPPSREWGREIFVKGTRKQGDCSLMELQSFFWNQHLQLGSSQTENRTTLIF